jgi:hypothetical protein
VKKVEAQTYTDRLRERAENRQSAQSSGQTEKKRRPEIYRQTETECKTQRSTKV